VFTKFVSKPPSGSFDSISGFKLFLPRFGAFAREEEIFLPISTRCHACRVMKYQISDPSVFSLRKIKANFEVTRHRTTRDRDR